MRDVIVEFECIICGDTATATVPAEERQPDEEPLETLRECPTCKLETIWIEA